MGCSVPTSPGAEGARGGRWKPSGLIRASAVLHAGALASLAVPGAWPWAAGAVVANHAALTAIGMMPRSPWLGPNMCCLPASAARQGQVALTFDDGPDPVLTPRVMAMLEHAQARATFFVVGERARRYPELVRALIAAGHTVENHTHTHPLYFAALGLSGQRRQIEEAQAAIEAAGGRPRYFRPPVGLRSPLLYPVLARLGLVHASWSRRGGDGLLTNPVRILHRLRKVGAGDIVLLHDGTWRPPTAPHPVLTVLPTLLAQLRQAGLRVVPLPDPDHADA